MIGSFPARARKEVGYQIDRVQRGEEPKNWKPMAAVGPGVREIRISEGSGAYRVIYVANVGDAIYVLHAFQKKTQATAKRDIELATMRYRELIHQ